jgi:hypothetical protein
VGNLASAVDELVALDVDGLPTAALGELLGELRRQINRLEGVYYRAVERFDRRGGAAEGGAESTQGWLRDNLLLAPATASRDVHLARELADLFPAVHAGMLDGGITPAHAQAATRLHHVVDDDTVRAIDPPLADAGSAPRAGCAAWSTSGCTPTPPTRRCAANRTTTPPAGCPPVPPSAGSASATGCSPRSPRKP